MVPALVTPTAEVYAVPPVPEEPQPDGWLPAEPDRQDTGNGSTTGLNVPAARTED